MFRLLTGALQTVNTNSTHRKQLFENVSSTASTEFPGQHVQLHTSCHCSSEMTAHTATPIQRAQGRVRDGLRSSSRPDSARTVKYIQDVLRRPERVQQSHPFYQKLSPEALNEELGSFLCLKHHVLNRMLKERQQGKRKRAEQPTSSLEFQ